MSVIILENKHENSSTTAQSFGLLGMHCSSAGFWYLMIKMISQPERGQIMSMQSKVRVDGLVQERRNSSALAMELRLSCTNPSICNYDVK